MTNPENILIDIIEFSPSLPMVYEEVIWRFSSDHQSCCCESHELCLDEAVAPFETAKQFLSKVDKIEIKWTPWMGITLRLIDWKEGFPIFIPWRGYNNGYYGSNIELTIDMPNGSKRVYDCSDYQDIS